ncbi:MAG: BON domain-containing protein [Longimicrobiales bacterium]
MTGPLRALRLALLLGVFAGPVAAQTQPYPVPDDVLKARVEAAIAHAADLPADSLVVEASSGVVTITGSLLCNDCGGNATPSGTGTVQQSLGAVVRAVPGVAVVRFALSYRPR